MGPYGREHMMKVKLELRLDDAAGYIGTCSSRELVREDEKEERKMERRRSSARQRSDELQRAGKGIPRIAREGV